MVGGDSRDLPGYSCLEMWSISLGSCETSSVMRSDAVTQLTNNLAALISVRVVRSLTHLGMRMTDSQSYHNKPIDASCHEGPKCAEVHSL
jgi:hypothetical protein